MTTAISLPGYTPASGGETPPPGGLRGEVADNSDTERPDLKRRIAVGGAMLTVEDSSGIAFAEATGAAGLVAPAAVPAVTGFARGRRPALIAAAFLCGMMLAMLSGSSRRRAEPGSPFTA
jgi:hypothetical protein